MTDFFKPEEKPWFKPPPSFTPRNSNASAAVIGAGLAGCAVAHHLAKTGISVRVLEEKPAISSAASGNPSGLFKPQVNYKNSNLTSYYDNYYQYFIDYLESLLEEYPELTVNRSGIYRLTGHFQHRQCRFLPNAGSLNPALFCKVQLQHPNIDVAVNAKVAGFKRHKSHWVCLDSNSIPLSKSHILILANSLDAKRFKETEWLPLAPLSGQISFLSQDAIIPPVKQIKSGLHYVIPQHDDGYICGATHHRRSESVVSEEDHDSNIDGLRLLLPQHQIFRDRVTGGRSSIRCITPDHLPVLGAIPNREFFRRHYESLHHGRRNVAFPAALYHEGLYIISGLGAHGIASSPYLAHFLTRIITTGVEHPDNATTELLHPARFLVRELRKKPADRSPSFY